MNRYLLDRLYCTHAPIFRHTHHTGLPLPSCPSGLVGFCHLYQLSPPSPSPRATFPSPPPAAPGARLPPPWDRAVATAITAWRAVLTCCGGVGGCSCILRPYLPTTTFLYLCGRAWLPFNLPRIPPSRGAILSGGLSVASPLLVALLRDMAYLPPAYRLNLVSVYYKRRVVPV